MSADYGLRVSLRLQDSPLWRLPARAFRLWVYLAMKGQHSRQTRRLRDGQRVTVQPGQWLTSRRRLQAEAGYTSPKAVVADLRILEAAGVVTTATIPYQRFQIGTVGGSKSEPQGTGERFQIGTASCVLATLVTVHGCRTLREGGGSKSEPRSTKGHVHGLTPAEQAENARAEHVLRAEGRWPKAV